MQIIKEENIPDIKDDFFKGSPFDDLFKGFFGKRGQNKPRKATSLGSGFVVKVGHISNSHIVVVMIVRLIHSINNSSVNRLETILDIRKSSRDNNTHSIVQV
jgi:hypothetical protein